MIDKLGHYSLTNSASVYDEEAMTTLELAGRTVGKVNECIDAFNKLEGTIDKSVDSSVTEHIQKGTFDKQIDAHTKALTKEVDELSKDVRDFDHRLDNLVMNGSENSPEVVDIRLGADGKTYDTAGGAVRAQLREKVGKAEFYPVEYEGGSLGISASGWDYSDTYAQNSRVRTKEGRQLKLFPGDVIGLSDYRDARFYLGFKVGDTYTHEAWRTSDYTVQSECECVILVAHLNDPSRNSPEDPDILGSLIFVRKHDSTANRANHANDNIQNALNVDLQMVLGGMNTSEGVYGTRTRFVTRDILNLPFDVVLKHSDKCRMALYTYPDSTGRSPVDKGWVTDNHDYIVKAGTFFRVMVMAESYEVEAVTDISPLEQYDSELYKAIRIEPVNGKGINLMNTAKTLGRIASFKAMSLNKRVATPRKVKAINHRGYNFEATENTLKAYKLSKKNGFDFVECDVRFSSDGVAVLFHDDTVDRISEGSGRVCDKTFADLQALDLGGEKIATFEEFIRLCATLQLHPYIEIEPDGDNPITMEQTSTLVDIVKRYGMLQNVTWISFRIVDLQKVVALDPFARVGFLATAEDTNIVKKMQNLASVQTGLNEVFMNIAYQNPSLGEYIEKCSEMFVPVEVWTINSDYADGLTVVENNPYISGVTSDDKDIGAIIIEKMVTTKTILHTYVNGYDGGADGFDVPFEEGMTWGEWFASDYCTVDGSQWDGNYWFGYSVNDETIMEPVTNDTVIIDGHTYYLGT